MRWLKPSGMRARLAKSGQNAAICGKLAAMKANPRGKKREKSPRSRPASFLVLHGPNLNLLGTREPAIYGSETLAAINRRLARRAAAAGARLSAFQSNHEGELVTRIQRVRSDGVDFVIINPAAYTHTSVAIRDALAAVAVPYVEVHLSNVHAREPFRRQSYFSDRAVGVICGFGSSGYDFALEFALQRFG
jgi:3-dehydroquinate dehydratase-2